MATPHDPAAKPRLVRCPACGGDSVYSESNPYRPFCSQRCKLADLDNWLSGTYRISTPIKPTDLDDDEVKLS